MNNGRFAVVPPTLVSELIVLFDKLNESLVHQLLMEHKIVCVEYLKADIAAVREMQMRLRQIQVLDHSVQTPKRSDTIG